MTRERNILILVCALLLAAIVYCDLQIRENQAQFAVTGSSYSGNEVPGWFLQQSPASGFRPVNLPFFLNAGRFRVSFSGSGGPVNIRLIADDCVTKAYVDGALVYKGACSPCIHCNGLTLPLNTSGGSGHLLAVETRDLGVDKVFYVENNKNPFLWQLLLLVFGGLLLICAYLLVEGRNDLVARISAIWGNPDVRSFLLVLAIALILRVLLSGTGSYGDIRYFMVRAENFIHSPGPDFSNLSADYNLTLVERGFLSKPPGAAEYPLSAIRLFFGFTRLYYLNLVKIPAILGDMAVAYAIWSFLRQMNLPKDAPLLAACLYLFNPGVLITSTPAGKTDALALALLLLAIKHQGRARFQLYYGLSLVCKQFPIFMLPWLLIQKKMYKAVLVAGILAFVLIAPFALSKPGTFIQKAVLSHLEKPPLSFSWVNSLTLFGLAVPSWFPFVLISAYLLVLVLLAFKVRAEGFIMGAMVFCLFYPFCHVVYYEYLLWSLPFTLIAYFLTRKSTVLLAFLCASTSMSMNFNFYSILEGFPIGQWNIILALVMLGAAADLAAGQMNAKKTETKTTDPV